MSGLGRNNEVRGCPGWYYGLRVTSDDGSCAFHVFNVVDGRRIEGLRASRNRTTTVTRRLGERDLRGYEHEARLAIKALDV